MFSCIRLFATPWTTACQTPLFMGFSRQEYWSGLPFSSPGHLPDPGIKIVSLESSVLAQIPCHCPHGSVIKNPPADAGDTCSIPGLGRFQLPQSNKRVQHIYWAHALDPGAATAEACLPKSLSSATQRPAQWEARTLQLESNPALCN